MDISLYSFLTDLCNAEKMMVGLIAALNASCRIMYRKGSPERVESLNFIWPKTATERHPGGFGRPVKYRSCGLRELAISRYILKWNRLTHLLREASASFDEVGGSLSAVTSSGVTGSPSR
jgi:hypothetical protein